MEDYLSLEMKEKDLDKIKEILKLVLLEPERYQRREVDKTLSSEERKRIELASTFTMEPRLVILDEPGSGVDILTLDSIIKMRVLFPTDFSVTSYRAFDYLEEIVKKGCKRATLVHIKEKARIEKHLEHRLDELNRIDMERLQMLGKRLMEGGAEDDNLKIFYGKPTSEILKEINRDDYLLIVMGSQGRGLAKEVFLGSVSCNIARNAPISILLIPAVRKI